MPDNTMPKINISLDKQDYERFTQLAKREKRKYNQQLLFLMDFYLAHIRKRKDKDVDDLTELSYDLRERK